MAKLRKMTWGRPHSQTQLQALGKQVPSQNLTSEGYGERLQVEGLDKQSTSGSDPFNYWHAPQKSVGRTLVTKGLFFIRPH